MGTYNLCFYGELIKIIRPSSPNIPLNLAITSTSIPDKRGFADK